ncbi:MAG: hypothetical protein ACE5H1_00780 [Thermodesulfobacteriota bacterium]
MTKNWEDAFNLAFPIKGKYPFGGNRSFTVGKVKKFIHNLLKEQREGFMKELEDSMKLLPARDNQPKEIQSLLNNWKEHISRIEQITQKYSEG